MEGITIREYKSGTYNFDFRKFKLQTYSVCSFASPGTVIIFNHFDFSNAPEKLGQRYGTEKDVEKLTEIFKNFDFTVYSYDDLTKENITKQLNEHISTVDWENSGSLVLIVLTHGEENGMLWASDKQYHCSQLWDPILQEDRLKDKFKFIILQACRGRKREKRFHLQQLQSLAPSIQNNTETSNNTEQVKTDARTEVINSANNLTDKALPNAANNLLIAHSTIEGCNSMRDTERGTWYIQMFCHKFKDWRREGVDLLEVLTFLNLDLTQLKEGYNKNEGQTASFTSFLNKIIIYKETGKYYPLGSSYISGNLFKGRVYIYYDKNHVQEAKEFSETMNKLLLLPILHEIDHGDTALTHMCKISHKNDFYHENFLIFAVFTKCESIIHNNVPLKLIYNNFNIENCPSLANVIKIFFFFDANYMDEMDLQMDYSGSKSRTYTTNHADFLICRGHSKEFLHNLNRELLRTFEDPSYNLIQIITAAKIGESLEQDYTSNFESTLWANVVLDPTQGVQFPIYLIEEKNIEKPIFHHHNVKSPVTSFTGRDEQVKRLIAETSSKSPGKKVITISGMSGVGKTQIVSVFCKYFAWMFSNILWIDAENEQSLNNSFKLIAVELKLVSKDDVVNCKTLVLLVYEYFKKNEKSLFVFDNYTEIALQYLPDHVGSYEIYHVLTTNVTKTTIDSQVLIEIDSFSEQESLEFLNKIIDNTNNSDSCYKNLAEMLGNFPLVLHLSASYIKERQLVFAEYSLDSFIKELLTQSINVTKLHPDNQNKAEIHSKSKYETTFYYVCKLKVSKIEEQNKLALLILYILCYCEPDNVPLNVFTYLLKVKPEIDQKKLDTKSQKINEDKLLYAIGILLNESLITKRKRRGSIHRLSQECIRGILQENGKEISVLKRSIHLIKCLLKCPKEFEEFDMNAIKIYNYSLQYLKEFEFHYETAISISRSLLNTHKVDEAKEFITSCNEIFESEFGIHSIPSLSLKQELVVILNKDRSYETSLDIIDRIILLIETKYGENSIDLMNAKIEKAKCLQCLGQYDNSLDIINFVLSWYNDESSQSTKNTLKIEKIAASVFLDKKEYQTSLNLLSKILEEERNLYPKIDIHIINTLKYIALIYEKDLDTEKKAVETYQDILFLLCRFDEIDHVHISEIQLKLDTVLSSIYARNETLHIHFKEAFKKSLETNIETLGNDHMETIIVKTNLINCISSFQNQRWQTLDLVDDLAKICKNKFGSEHERTLQVKLRRARVLKLIHRKQDAIKIYKKLHEVYVELYGSSHFNTECVSHELENTKKVDTKLEEIVLSYESLLYEKRDIIRDEIHDELFSLSRLANIKLEQENYLEAIQIYDQMITLEEKYLPQNDICNLITKYNKYQACKFVNNAEYKDGIQETFKIAQETLGDMHDLVELIKREVELIG